MCVRACVSFDVDCVLDVHYSYCAIATHSPSSPSLLHHWQELERQSREKNRASMAKVFTSLTSINFRTTWADVGLHLVRGSCSHLSPLSTLLLQVQKLLLEHPAYTDNDDLLSTFDTYSSQHKFFCTYIYMYPIGTCTFVLFHSTCTT